MIARVVTAALVALTVIRARSSLRGLRGTSIRPHVPQRVAVRCIVLHCVAAHCSACIVLQCVVWLCRALCGVVARCSVLMCVLHLRGHVLQRVCCVSRFVAVRCTLPRCVPVRCRALLCGAMR